MSYISTLDSLITNANVTLQLLNLLIGQREAEVLVSGRLTRNRLPLIP